MLKGLVFFIIHISFIFFRSIPVIFNASLPFFIHSFRLSIFDQFCAGLPASRSVTLSAEYLHHFSFLSILPVFVLDLDLVIGVCTFLGSPMLKIVCFGATMVQDVLFPLAGEASVNYSGLSFLLKYVFGSIGALAYLLGAIWAALSSVLGTWLEVYPS